MTASLGNRREPGIWCPPCTLVSFAMTKTKCATGTSKVLRECLGSKRAPGWELQKVGRRVRRANASALQIGKTDSSLSSAGGLVSFNAFMQRNNVGHQLRKDFGHLK